MIIIGVTGGFGTGKTTVSGFFRELGAKVIDADRLVHELYGKDPGMRRALVRAFGRGVAPNGKISRKRLGEVVFADRSRLKKLTGMVHPRVIKQIKMLAKNAVSGVLVVDAPLLIESGLTEFVDFILTVKAPGFLIRRRAGQRGFSGEDLRKRTSAQMPIRKKIALSDFVINNNRSKKHVKREVKKIWQKVTRG